MEPSQDFIVIRVSDGSKTRITGIFNPYVIDGKERISLTGQPVVKFVKAKRLSKAQIRANQGPAPKLTLSDRLRGFLTPWVSTLSLEQMEALVGVMEHATYSVKLGDRIRAFLKPLPHGIAEEQARAMLRHPMDLRALTLNIRHLRSESSQAYRAVIEARELSVKLVDAKIKFTTLNTEKQRLERAALQGQARAIRRRADKRRV